MTANLINYWRNVEQERSNRAMEEETRRANIAREEENSRHNAAMEAISGAQVSLGYAQLGEQKRSNNLTFMSNLGRTNLGYSQLDETIRNNDLQYSLGSRAQDTASRQANTAATNASINMYKAQNEALRNERDYSIAKSKITQGYWNLGINAALGLRKLESDTLLGLGRIGADVFGSMSRAGLFGVG